MNLKKPFTLPCGLTLKNRICKAALTERIAGADHLPNQYHHKLYRHWSRHGAGLLISGNIMLDPQCLESGGNIVLTKDSPLDPFRKWTQEVQKDGTAFWAQINHPGRQATIFSSLRPMAPSQVQVKKLGLFAKPRSMTQPDIIGVIDQFVETATRCKEGGFSGVQIHAAHGYLINQFLSPKTNNRVDKWGGSLENRARLLFSIIDGVRIAVGHDFAVSVKLNSADFQSGGFSGEDAFWVIKQLDSRNIDLLEISGGTYESLVFLSKPNRRQSSIDREGYFLDFAKRIRKETRLPIMVTGGFRSLEFCKNVLLNRELDIIGFGRPFLLEDTFPKGFLERTLNQVVEPNLTVKLKAFQGMEEAGWYDYQIHRLSRGKSINLNYSPLAALFRMTKDEFVKGIRNKLRN